MNWKANWISIKGKEKGKNFYLCVRKEMKRSTKNVLQGEG